MYTHVANIHPLHHCGFRQQFDIGYPHVHLGSLGEWQVVDLRQVFDVLIVTKHQRQLQAQVVRAYCLETRVPVRLDSCVVSHFGRVHLDLCRYQDPSTVQDIK